MKYKLLLATAIFLLIIPFSFAEEDGWFDFDWMDIGEKIAESFHNFILELVNAPLQPLLSAVKYLLQETVNTELFKNIWAIITYTISLLYGLLFMWSGLTFITSGHDPAKREKAKTWLKNILIMVVLINASFFLYTLMLEFNASLTQGILGLIDNNFFLLTGETFGGLGMELLASGLYLITLILTLLILTVRYIIVAFGVAFFPIGILLYFIEPLKSYGKLILNFLGITIFVTFFDALILLISSQLVEIPFFNSFKILLMTAAFTICNTLMLYLMFFAAIKAAFKTVVAVKSGPIGIVALAASRMIGKGRDPQRKLTGYM